MKSVLLPVCIFSAVLLHGWIAEADESFICTTNSGALTLTGYSGSGGTVIIPHEIFGLPVVSIGSRAFSGIANITNIVVPESVTNLRSGAFTAVPYLESIVLPNGVTKLPDSLFASCYRLRDVTLPNALTQVDVNAFNDCKGLQTVVFPASLTNTTSLFQGCNNLRSIGFLGRPPTGGSLGAPPSAIAFYCAGTPGWGATFQNLSTSLWDPVTGFGYYTNGLSATVNRYLGEENSLRVPAVVDGFPVVSIASMAFTARVFTNAVVPSGVTNIGYAAFAANSKLVNISLPDGLLSAGAYAFSQCPALQNIQLPETMVQLGEACFSDCSSLTNVALPAGLVTLPQMCFSQCENLASVDLRSVRNIGSNCFMSCYSVSSITLSAGLTNIDSYAFAACRTLTNMYFEGDAPTIGSGVFLYSSSTLYFLPGTTGWTSPFGGLPAAVWLPAISPAEPGYGTGTNQFGFKMSWASGRTVVVEASTEPTSESWSAISTNHLATGRSFFTDPEWTSFRQRFYRLRYP